MSDVQREPCRFCGDARRSIPKLRNKHGVECENIRACNVRRLKP